MDHLIKALDDEIERIKKTVDLLGKEHHFTIERREYISGLMGGMFLAQGISEKVFNQYGKILEDIVGQ